MRTSSGALLLCLTISTPNAGAETFGPYMGDVTTTAASIAWRTEQASTSRIEWAAGSSPAVLNERVEDSAPTVQHELRVEGLSPGAAYTYRVVSEVAGQPVFESGPHTFRSAAAAGQPFRFVFLAEVHEELTVAQFDPVIATFDPWMQIQPGDNIDDADQLSQFQNFFTRGSWYANVPLYNSFGNHNYQADTGGLIPRNTDAVLSLELLPPHARYYTFRYGQTQFFGLDSEHYLSRDVRDNEPAWFEQALQDATDGVDDPALMVAFFHIPVHSSCGELSCLRSIVENPWVERELVGRIERFGVHLVLNGHDKINEHSVVNGVHYVQVTSGASPRSLGGRNAGSMWADADGQAIMRASVDGCVLQFDIVRADATVLYSNQVTGDCSVPVPPLPDAGVNMDGGVMPPADAAQDSGPSEDAALALDVGDTGPDVADAASAFDAASETDAARADATPGDAGAPIGELDATAVPVGTLPQAQGCGCGVSPARGPAGSLVPAFALLGCVALRRRRAR